jgi:hypothetical protein
MEKCTFGRKKCRAGLGFYFASGGFILPAGLLTVAELQNFSRTSRSNPRGFMKNESDH